MSALKKVVNLLWYRTPKDHKLANELAEEFSKLEARIAELEAISKSDLAVTNNIISIKNKRIAELEAMTQWQPIEVIANEYSKTGWAEVWRSWKDNMISQGRKVNINLMDIPIPEQDVELDKLIAYDVVMDFMVWRESHLLPEPPDTDAK